MRVSWLALSAVIIAVNAIHPTLISRHRGDSPSPNLARHAHAPRALLDVCVSANLDLLANASQLLGLGSLLGPLLLDGKLDLCLCLKVCVCAGNLATSDHFQDLDVYLDTSAQARVFSRLLGRDTVSALISALVCSTFSSSRIMLTLGCRLTQLQSRSVVLSRLTLAIAAKRLNHVTSSVNLGTRAKAIFAPAFSPMRYVMASVGRSLV